MSYWTAWYMLHRIREAMKHPYSNLPLKGTVQADDAYVGGSAKGKRGRGAENKTLVAGAVEESEKNPGKVGRALFKVVENVSSEELVDNFINQNINEGSTIKTDGWKSYYKIDGN